MNATPRRTVVQTADGRPCIVTNAQFKLLDFVRKHPGAMYNEVANHVGFDRPTVNTYASLMEKVGLILRKHSRMDGRVRVMLEIHEGVCLDFDVARLQ